MKDAVLAHWWVLGNWHGHGASAVSPWFVVPCLRAVILPFLIVLGLELDSSLSFDNFETWSLTFELSQTKSQMMPEETL